MSPTITFGPSAAQTVLEQFGKTVDEDTGEVVDIETGEPVRVNDDGMLLTDGGEDEEAEILTIDEFGGVGKGSEIFVKEDYNSISEYVERYRSSE